MVTHFCQTPKVPQLRATEMEQVTFTSCAFCLNMLNAIGYISLHVVSKGACPPGSLWPCLDLDIREPFSLLLEQATVSYQQQETCSCHPLVPA